MSITDILLTASGVIGAVCAISAFVLAIVKWFLKQEKQSTDIKDIRDMHKRDMDVTNEDLCMISYVLLAVLDGLKQLHCNGEVTKAHEKLEKHLNTKAHGQNIKS